MMYDPLAQAMHSASGAYDQPERALSYLSDAMAALRDERRARDRWSHGCIPADVERHLDAWHQALDNLITHYTVAIQKDQGALQ